MCEWDLFVLGLIKFYCVYFSFSSLMFFWFDVWWIDSIGFIVSSIVSEVSFEVIKVEDMVSLYGGGGGVKWVEGFFYEEIYWGDELEWGFNWVFMFLILINEIVWFVKIFKWIFIFIVYMLFFIVIFVCLLLLCVMFLFVLY